MRNYLRTLFYNLLTIILFLVLLEAICRVALDKFYNRGFDSSLIIDNKYFNSAGLKENATGLVWGKEFHTDEFACRKGPKLYDAKKKKWLFIGDSVTEGVGVDDSATFASITSDRAESINVRNYSLIGYSVADYYNVLKFLLSKSDSSITKITIFFCLNDVYGSAKTNQLPAMAKQNWVGKVNLALQGKCATYKVIKHFLFQNADRYFQYDRQFYKEDDPHFIEAMSYLKGCDSLCALNGVKMNVIILPYRNQLSNKNAEMQRPQSLVKDFCAKHRIMFSDPLDFLRQAPDNRSFYLFADEIHLSAKGHRAMADFILSL